MDRSTRFFSRSSAARVRLPTISASNESGETSGLSMRNAALPTRPAAPMARQVRMTFAGLLPRMMMTAAVADTRATSVKNCQGRSVDASGAGCVGATGLIEIVQLFVEPRLKCSVFHGFFFRRDACRPPGLVDHDDAADDGDGARQRIREQPRQAVEAFVNRRAQKLLAAVYRHEMRQNLGLVLAQIDLRAQRVAHALRLAA